MFGWFGLIIGAILLVLGGYMVFFFPHAVSYQPGKFGAVGVTLGFIFLTIGLLLIFVPG